MPAAVCAWSSSSATDASRCRPSQGVRQRTFTVIILTWACSLRNRSASSSPNVALHGLGWWWSGSSHQRVGKYQALPFRYISPDCRV